MCDWLPRLLSETNAKMTGAEMQVTETLSEGLKRELKIVVPAADLEARLTERLGELKGQARIKGFRPGKVPMAHLRKVYGRSIMAEVVQQTVTETSQNVLTERDERPAFQPSISFADSEEELEEVMNGKTDLAYKVVFEVMPEIEIADLSKIKLTREVTEVPDADVEQAIERLADQNRPYESRKETEKAKSGDRITMDYEGSIDGTPFEGGKGENTYLVLGSGQFIPGFEDQLVGAKAGDDATIKLTFPDDYPASELAGKEAEFAVKVHEVAAPGKLEVDDAFAQNLGLENLDKLKEAIRGQIENEHSGISRRKLKRILLDELDAAHTLELPPTLVDQEFDSIWSQMTADMEQAGRTFEDEESDEETARAEYRTIAERRVRLGLVLAEIGEKNSVKVSEDEVSQAMAQQVRQFPGQEQQVWEYYQKNPEALASLRAPIFEDKVVDHILDQAAVTDKTVTREELMRDPDEDPAPAKKAKPKKAAADKKPAAKKAPAKKAPAKKAPAKKAAAKSDD